MKRFKYKIRYFIILVFSSVFSFAQAQEDKKIAISINVGGNVSNLNNSEAPHKVNIYGSDEHSVIGYLDAKYYPEYIEYESKIFGDILPSITFGASIEYILNQKISIQSGFNFEKKGLDLDYQGFNEVGEESTFYAVQFDEKYRIQIKNGYLIIPLNLKYYILSGRKLYLTGGIYNGFLLSSSVIWEKEKNQVRDNEILNEYNSWFDNEGNQDLSYTSKYDIGVSFGLGYNHSFSNNVFITTDVLFNVGLIQIDDKYDNEFEQSVRPSGTNFSSILLKSTNYHTLNSNAKNINAIAKIGIGYRF